ncbi:MAG: hypothetical protein C0602_11615 [Denitrovibrio sp.]|nr:MAG: hypothetical protein C0602_11615 [Denitrovibrio sp.]
MFYHHNKDKQLHRFSCTNCDAVVLVDFSRVSKNFVARCRNCGAEYPFSESDRRLVRKQKKHIK